MERALLCNIDTGKFDRQENKERCCQYPSYAQCYERRNPIKAETEIDRNRKDAIATGCYLKPTQIKLK